MIVSKLRIVGALTLALCACASERDNEIEADSAATSSPQTPAPEPATEQPTDQSTQSRQLTPDGWGPLRMGMSRAEVVQAAGEDANPNAVGGAEPAQCDQFRPRNAPEGLLVMLENGVLTRISVSRNADVKTAEGFGVGDAASAIVAQYGSRALVTPHKYLDAPAKYITVWRDSAAGQDRRGIRYEIGADDKVAHVHAGTASIEYVEGCL